VGSFGTEFGRPTALSGGREGGREADHGDERDRRWLPARPTAPGTTSSPPALARTLDLPILLTALLPLFITSPKAHWVEVMVGVGSWLVFLIDLVVQRRIVADYLHRREGRIDLGIVPLTFPYYLIPASAAAQ